jgi:hypothetical protein
VPSSCPDSLQLTYYRRRQPNEEFAALIWAVSTSIAIPLFIYPMFMLDFDTRRGDHSAYRKKYPVVLLYRVSHMHPDPIIHYVG